MGFFFLMTQTCFYRNNSENPVAQNRDNFFGRPWAILRISKGSMTQKRLRIPDLKEIHACRKADLKDLYL